MHRGDYAEVVTCPNAPSVRIFTTGNDPYWLAFKRGGVTIATRLNFPPQAARMILEINDYCLSKTREWLTHAEENSGDFELLHLMGSINNSVDMSG